MAVYGQTFSKAAEFHSEHHPQSVELALCDLSSVSLTCVAVEIAGVVSLIFGLFSTSAAMTSSSSPSAGGDADGAALVVMVYLLCFAGVSLCAEIFKAAIDALVVAYAKQPERVAAAHQIIALRFLRLSDPSLR